MAKSQKNNTEKKGNIFGRVLYGQVISSDFFARNWLFVFAALIVIIIFITNKYNCQTKMEEIKRLNTELEIIKTERIRVRSEYMSKTRESSMQNLIDSLHLNLRIQDRPPYNL